jgi:hypothetical protein
MRLSFIADKAYTDGAQDHVPGLEELAMMADLVLFFLFPLVGIFVSILVVVRDQSASHIYGLHRGRTIQSRVFPR